jgi:hypothetical protein
MEKRRLVLGLLLSVALFTGPAFAAQNVANTSQKGSLLKFPNIDVRDEDSATTTIEISNDLNIGVNLTCVYVNEKKDRTDFHFFISHKGTVSWDVLSGKGEGDIGPLSFPLFPSGGSFPGDPGKGELTCFAVDQAGANQIAWNHLAGTATVLNFDDDDADQILQAYKYNAWAFTARSDPGTTVPDGTSVGTAGNILLTGGGTGTYDACPLYLIANFSPGGATFVTGRGNANYVDDDLAVASCNEDLRQDFLIHLTKLNFAIWNSKQTKFTGSYICSDSVLEFGLIPPDAPSALVHPENFTFGVLGTTDARFQVAGVASSVCPRSEATGLVGVLTTSLGIADTTETNELGATLHGAGVESGFVLWDPQPSIVPQAPKKH